MTNQSQTTQDGEWRYVERENEPARSRGWFEYTDERGWMRVVQPAEANDRLNALTRELAETRRERDEALAEARRWKGHHDTQVRWKRTGKGKARAHYEGLLTTVEADATRLRGLVGRFILAGNAMVHYLDNHPLENEHLLNDEEWRALLAEAAGEVKS